MTLTHEYINYEEELLPINWIFHHPIEQVTTILPHWHESVEISYTRKGSISSFVINGISYTTEPGDILLMNPVEVHSAMSPYHPELEALTILISLDFLKKLIPDLEFKRFVTHPTSAEHAKDNYQKLEQCLEKFFIVAHDRANKYNAIELKSVMYELIFLMAEDWLYEVDYSMVALVNDKKLGKIEQIVKYIQDNDAESISINSLAEQFHISPYYVSKLFKNKLNIGVMTYVQLVRVRNAEALLISTDKPVHIISDLVGFPNEKSFRKFFARVFQQTPKQYQLSHKKNT